MMVVFGAEILDPFGHADVTIAERHRPWTGQRVVNAGNLVEHRFRIALADSEPLFDDSGVVVVKWNAAAVIAMRIFQTTGLDRECVVTAIAVVVEPSANRIAVRRMLQILGPVAAVRVNTP